MNDPEAPRYHPELASDRSAGELLALGFLDGDDAPFPPRKVEQPGMMVGPYLLIAPLGEGGFGCVWHARQTEPVRRDIALKLIKPGMDSREIVARFEAERQAIAIMDHPNIAAVLDAGATPEGRPFFAMELVKGEPLTQYCDSRHLSIRQRLELFVPVCQAVQHAHQKSILHRDLKPSNILVSAIDGKPVPKVIDFGIAKALGTGDGFALRPGGLRTRVGVIVGTPEYMSPEQAGSVSDVDTRSDIYSLGVLLYELLTGQTPLALAGLDAGHDEMLRRVRSLETPKPSSRFHPPTEHSLVAAATRDAEPAKLRRTLKRDLDWIVLKALEKDRRRRYETATALAADLSRYLLAEPVSAAAPTWHYQFSKLVRRNLTAFAAAATVFLTLTAATTVSLWQAREARKSTAESELSRIEAERSRIEADRSRAEAEANAARARSTVETYLTKVTDHEKLREEPFQGLRKELLETALPFYQELAAKDGNDPGVRLARADLLAKLGALYRNLGQREKAETTLRQAVEIEEQLTADFPENTGYQHARIVTGNNLSVVLGENGKPEDAIAVQQGSLDRIDQLLRNDPENPGYAIDLSILLVSVGRNLANAGHLAESEAAIVRAIDIRQKLSAASPESQSYRHELAASYSELARMLAENKRFNEADPWFRKALAMIESQLESNPADPQLRRAFADTSYNFAFYLNGNDGSQEALVLLLRSIEMNRKLALDYPVDSTFRFAQSLGNLAAAEALRNLTRNAEADESIGKALELQRGLAADFPGNAIYFHLAGGSLEKLGEYRRETGNLSGARENFLEAVEMQRKASGLQPADNRFREALGRVLSTCGEICLLTHDAGGAMAAALELPSHFPKSWEKHEQAALLLTRAIPLLHAEEPVEPNRRLQEINRASHTAIGFLKTSVSLGNPQLTDPRNDGRLTALREDPDFNALEKLLAPDPTGRSPASFRFNYTPSDPGPRIWTRDGSVWTEKSPSGTEKKFNVVRRIRFGSVSGTELLATGTSGLSIFVPDLGSPEPAGVKMKQRSGGWVNFATIERME